MIVGGTCERILRSQEYLTQAGIARQQLDQDPKTGQTQLGEALKFKHTAK